MRIGLLISLILLTLSTYVAPVAQAYMYNLVLDQEYYTRNMNPNRGWLFVSGGATPYDGLTPDWTTVDITVDSFINAVRVRLFDGSSFINRARASVLMNMMLGYDSTDPRFNGPAAQRAQNGVAIAQANWNLWEGLIRAYDARGWVEWNVDILGCQGDIDGFGAAADPLDTVHRPDVTFSAIARAGCGMAKSVRFHVNGSATAVFRITDLCANLTGEQTPLANFNIQTAISSGAGTPPAGGNVLPTTPYQVVPQGWNSGPGIVTPPITYRLTVPAGITVTNTNGGVQVGNVITWTGITYPALGPGAGVNRFVDWMVNTGVPGGTLLTFSFQAQPRNFSGAPTPPVTITYRVASIRQPAFQGLSGDIHAGGGLCNQPLTPGFVTGYPGGTSFGEYVVAAAGLITNVKSNGTGVDRLKLGATGNYAQVCRPDLLSVANAYITGGGAINTFSGSLNVTGRSGVWVANAGPVTLSGTVNRNITVVVRSGNVRISGPITLDTSATAASALPSLGIIAQGAIEIPAAVTRVDAYMFASTGVINTCVEANNSCATPTLVVNGFMMGRDILFNRLGPFNTNGAQVGERVNLNPNIYLNPPRFFGADADDVLLEGQGERQPLF
jgi:hypothetical protein